jgi:hypothetical protein
MHKSIVYYSMNRAQGGNLWAIVVIGTVPFIHPDKIQIISNKMVAPYKRLASDQCMQLYMLYI